MKESILKISKKPSFILMTRLNDLKEEANGKEEKRDPAPTNKVPPGS
jgi:hypothetical protein